MVGGVSAGWALRDLFYASGLGFLLSVLYTAARAAAGPGKTARFLCDAALPVLGAVLYRSAAVSRFYAGQPRWYTLAGCVLCFFAGYAALAPLCRRIGRRLHEWLFFPLAVVHRRVLHPAAQAAGKRFRIKKQACTAFFAKKTQAERKKRLQSTSRVLYNSKRD